jgi:L-rhamnose isomerase
MTTTRRTLTTLTDSESAAYSVARIFIDDGVDDVPCDSIAARDLAAMLEELDELRRVVEMIESRSTLGKRAVARARETYHAEQEGLHFERLAESAAMDE